MTLDEDSIRKVVELDAPVSRVWQALTDYRQFGRWFRVDLDQPFAPGGRSTGRMTEPGYEHVPWLATVEHIEPERVFSFRWYVHDEDTPADEAGRPTTLVTFELEPVRNGTRLTITESGFSAVPDPLRLEAMRRNTHGWNVQAERIAAHVGAAG